MLEEKQPQSSPPAGGTSSAPDFNKLELEILKFWDENKIFEKSLEATKGKEPYVFFDGPPFATGLPHYGSILPSVIKDCIPRYQTMKGRYVRRRWGWDCHGLPIENLVEKNLKISGKQQIEEVGVARFNQICRDNVLMYAREWGKTISRVARWVEFENSYKTMDGTYQESVWWALKQIWDKGLIYQDRKVLLYCSRCETPISNFEVAMDNSYRDITEESVYAKFKMPKGQRIVNDLTNDRTYALAWTTTPWTLPGNTSLNVGAGIAYVLIECENKDRYILAKERLPIIDGEYELISEFFGSSLENLQYEPLYPGVIPSAQNQAKEIAGAKLSGKENAVGDPSNAHKFYLADFVTTEDGTGIVHNAAMYGEEDYQLAREKNLPRINMLDHKGKYLNTINNPAHLRGVFFKDADKIVLEDLKKTNLLYKSEQFTHSYPHCYRCATPLFYNALPAWFINIQKIKPELIANNQNINWYPEHLKFGRFQQGILNAPDWNISRNRYWATALPFWQCSKSECKNVLCVGSVADLREKSVNFAEVYPAAELRIKNYESGSDIHNSYFILHNSDLDLHKPYIDQIKLKCEKCQSIMSRVPEVVDCWVESGSMPFAELHYPFENKELFEKRFPSDFVVEYIPQTRAWFYVMHVISTILFGKAPFKNVMTTGTILGEDGTKMSKSKGNYPDANVVIEKYGADALRFYLLTNPVVSGEDISFSEKNILEINRKLSLMLYNIWSFYRMYEKSAINYQLSTISPSHVLDIWILSMLSQTHSQVTALMDKFNTAKAGKVIMDFINDISTWYLRRSRERIKNGGNEGRLALQTLGLVIVETCKMLAPFTPFLSEYIYRDVTGQESVHLSNWSEGFFEADKEALSQMRDLRGIVEAGLSLRKDLSLKVRQPLGKFWYGYVNSKNILPKELEAVLAEELNVKEVEFGTPDSLAENIKNKIGAEYSVAFDITITPELKLEGLAREVERQVQDLRKKSGLKVGELVNLYYNTASLELEKILLTLVDRKKTFISQINKSLEVEVEYESQSQIDGQAVWIGMNKI